METFSLNATVWKERRDHYLKFVIRFAIVFGGIHLIGRGHTVVGSALTGGDGIRYVRR